MDYQRYIDALDDWIVTVPGRIVLVFLLVTALFGLGLGNVSTEAGTEQFATGVPAEEAFTEVNEKFGPTFSDDGGTTQLIQRSDNVLAKPSLLRLLEAQDRLEARPQFRVESTSSAASTIAQTLEPNATAVESQIDVIERATPSQIDAAVRQLAGEPQFTGTLSNDFNPSSASASATIAVVRHDVPGGVSESAGQSGTSPLTPIQVDAKRVVDSVGGDLTVFGSGIVADEFSSVILDSLVIVTPAAVVFIVLFLIVAYRDPMDLLLGILALLITIVWTFGFMGLTGIPFTQMLIAVPPLLLAVGIDFGIHAINRYREERVDGKPIDESMRETTDQLLVAFFIVTGTTVIGFLANFSSELPPIRDFGLVASVGIVFTFLVFGIFLPAAKVFLDRLRERYPIPTLSRTPLGAEGSFLGRLLTDCVVIARRIPRLFLAFVLVVSLLSGAYATGIDTSFSQEDFLPPEQTPPYLAALPEPFKPSDYSVVGTLNFLEDNFAAAEDDTVTIYVEGPMTRSYALESIHRPGNDVPSTFVTQDGRADSQSIVTVIQQRAAEDPAFRRLVERNDRNDNGVPDDDLRTIYQNLSTGPTTTQVDEYLTDDRRATRVVYAVDAGADQEEITQDARRVADRYRYTAIATGQIVVFQAISDLILQSAITSLAIAILGTAAFLVVIYHVLEGRASLGLANLVPILVTVALIAGTMRFIGLSFNAVTATILAITIGLGIDYSVHVVHRFVDEYHERGEAEIVAALRETLRGTGGALTGSMLTTVFGIGVLVLSLFPAIGSFGVITGVSVFYSYLASLLVLPPTLALWARFVA